jgi:hypothetical protein
MDPSIIPRLRYRRPGQYHVADGPEVLLLKMNETYPDGEEGRERIYLVL